MTDQERIELERALEQLDTASAIVAEASRSAAVAAVPLAQVQQHLEHATRRVWEALQGSGR